MRNGDAIVIEHIKRVAHNIFFLFTPGIGLHARDKHAADLELARAVDHMCCTLDRISMIVSIRVMADRDNLSLEFKGA